MPHTATQTSVPSVALPIPTDAQRHGVFVSSTQRKCSFMALACIHSSTTMIRLVSTRSHARTTWLQWSPAPASISLLSTPRRLPTWSLSTESPPPWASTTTITSVNVSLISKSLLQPPSQEAARGRELYERSQIRRICFTNITCRWQTNSLLIDTHLSIKLLVQ